jgi:mRNA interferase MazF
MQRKYIPDRGDIVWLNLDPQVGREQVGRRPALVLSDKEYNSLTGLAVCCPITSQEKYYPFEVSIPKGLPISGVILCDHIKNLDIRGRIEKFICKLPPDTVAKVVKRVTLLISPKE